MIRKLRWKVIGIIMAMAAVLLAAVFSSMYVAAEQNYRRRSEEAIRTALMAEMPDGAGRAGEPGKGGPGAEKTQQPEDRHILESALSQTGNGQVQESVPLQPENGQISERVPMPMEDGQMLERKLQQPGDGQMAESAPSQPEKGAMSETTTHADQAILVLKREADGTIREIHNTTIHQTETEYESLIAAAEAHGGDRGELKNEKLRYQCRRNGENGTVCYVFADMYEEMRALSEQIVHSICIGAAALVLFFLAALWFSRWAVRPVEEAWKREQQFVADASHELKTPLTVILANAEMVLRDMTKNENMAAAGIASVNREAKKQTQKEPTEREDAGRTKAGKNVERMHFIKEEAERMKQLTEALLSLARSDAGTVVLEKTEVLFSELAEFQAASFEPVLFEAGKMLQTEIEEGIKIQGDEKKLRQLLEILLDNAGKYSVPGSKIRISLKRNGEKGVCLCVENETENLTEEMCRHLFDRFYRADTSRGSVPGYGLGLSIAQSIVKEHGGTIEAVCRDGKMEIRVEI